MASLQDRAAKGDDWATDQLLSRPSFSTEAAPYWAAFVYLGRDRQHDSISMGMAGSLSLPRPVPREAIRREGERRGYSGESLDDFVEIVAGIDDIYIEVTVKRAADDAKSAARASKKR